MYCENCGKKIRENCTFCPECGCVIAKNKQFSNQSSNYTNGQYGENRIVENSLEKTGGVCSVCGASVPEGYKLCPDCSERTYKKSSDRSTKIVVILSVLVAFVAMILIALVILKGNGVLFSENEDVIETSFEDNNEDDAPSESPEDENEENNEKVEEEEEVKTEKTYEVYETYYPITWKEAKRIAEERGGYIAVANSKEEFEKMYEAANKKEIVVFWMGVKRTGDDWTDVTCLDGSENLPYANWLVTQNASEPSLNYNGVEERYLMAVKNNGSWYFNDAPNDISDDYSAETYRNKISFIIEKDA